MSASCKLPDTDTLHRYPGENAFKCPWCGCLGNSVYELSQHKRQQHKPVRLRCFLCDFSSRNVGKWVKHVTSNHHVDMPSLVTLASVPRVSTCKEQHQSSPCLRISQLEQQETKEITSTESEQMVLPCRFFCRNCSYSTSKEHKLARHVERKHNSETEGQILSAKTLPEPNIVKCPYCNSLHSGVRDVTKHCKAEHSMMPPYTCLECERQFQGMYKLVAHMRSHSGNKPFSCNVCLYKTSVKNSLILHMRTHTGHRPYRCEACDLAFKTSSDLIAHRRVHSQEKPFKCEYCKYKSKTANNLSRHIKYHTNNRPHKCTFCDYAAIQKVHLVAHLRTHTKQKPFQ